MSKPLGVPAASLAPQPVTGGIEIDSSAEALGRLEQMCVVMLGMPGSGKTTLVEELVERNPNIDYISVGKISRELPSDSEQRRELDVLFDEGAPVGDASFFLRLIEPRVDEAMAEGRGFILDGIPKKEEEVEPLLKWLAKKGIIIDLVVSCELPALAAYERLATRPERVGDKDTMGIFMNRVAAYTTGLDSFKQGLTYEGEVSLVVLDTNANDPQTCADQLLSRVTELPASSLYGGAERVLRDIELKEQLGELLASGDSARLQSWYGDQFDDYLPGFDHSLLTREGIDDDGRLAIVIDAFAERDPSLMETPLFLKRLAENYMATTYGSFAHLAESLQEEAALRFGENFTASQAFEVFRQQRSLKELMAAMQEQLVGGRDLFEVLDQELHVNGPELLHIGNALRKRAEHLGMDPETVDMRMLMGLQAALWGQFTSNQVLFAPDVNYRRRANGVPGSHHSLLPFTYNPRAFAANNMGNYVPFIEAVSATEVNGFSSTFGFAHFMGMDSNGEAYGAEYPILMRDQRLIDLKSAVVDAILDDIESLYGNHDLWHNLIPVYADHFILHHPQAPISYGGRLDPYVQFGRELREFKEEYEIGVAMAHARTQQERFLEDPALREQQAGYILSALDRIGTLYEDLAGKRSPEQIAEIVDYLASRAAAKSFNVFPPNDPIYAVIDEKMAALGIPEITISAGEVATLLWKQRLISLPAAAEIMGRHGVSEDQVVARLDSDVAFAVEVLGSAIDLTRPDRETGAEHIGGALAEWGAIESLTSTGSLVLSGSQKARWLAIMGPQREQLRGHMEKVHGKSGYLFGTDRELEDPRDLALMQFQAIEANREDYQYRLMARAENQRLSYALYSLLFDDGQEFLAEERATLNELRHGNQPGETRAAVETFVRSIDAMIEQLVKASYDNIDAELEKVIRFAEQAGGTNPALVSAISGLVDRYRELERGERNYQQHIGMTYAEAERRMVDEQMTIS